MAALTLRKTDGGVGATLPDDVLARLNVSEGDTLTIVHTSEGLLPTPVDRGLSEKLAAARRVMDENAAVLRALST